MTPKRKHVQSEHKVIDRPFAPSIMQRAREIADRYQIVIRHEDGEYFGRGLELAVQWTTAIRRMNASSTGRW